MIVSHKHRFVFIKTRKTAGTSIELSLSRFCGPEDILTPVSLTDEPLRGQFGQMAQNYLTARPDSVGKWRKRMCQLVSRAALKYPSAVGRRLRVWAANWHPPKGLHKHDFYNHMPLSEVRARLDQSLDDYFVFCFEREPLSKVVSDYRYRAAKMSMDDYLEQYPLPIDHPKYFENGQLEVDFVGRFEHLQEDLSTALDRVGIAFDGWLPRAKSTSPKIAFTTQDLTEAQRRRISQAFATELEILGYEGS